MRQPLEHEHVVQTSRVIPFNPSSLSSIRIVGKIKFPEENVETSTQYALDLLEYFFEETRGFISEDYGVHLRDIATKHYFYLESSLNHQAIFEAAIYIISLIERIIKSIPQKNIINIERVDLNFIREIFSRYNCALKEKDNEALEDVMFELDDLPFVQRKVLEILLCAQEA